MQTTSQDTLKKLTFEELAISDLPAIIPIESQVSYHPWGSTLFIPELMQKGFMGFVAKDEKGGAIGFIMGMTVADEGEIRKIAVATPYQRRGVGTRILNHFVLRLKRKKIKHIYLEVRHNNFSAIGLYKKVGFLEKALRKNYYGTGEHALIMRLSL